MARSRARSNAKPRLGRRSSESPTASTRADARGDRLRELQQALERLAQRLHDERMLRPGAIVFRVAEGQEAAFTLLATETGARVQAGAGHAQPLLEVMGDPRRLRSILLGQKDARMQFFAGGIRVRGDMHYLSELGMRLGFLKTPIV